MKCDVATSKFQRIGVRFRVIQKKYCFQGREEPEYQRKEMQDLVIKTNYIGVFYL